MYCKNRKPRVRESRSFCSGANSPAVLLYDFTSRSLMVARLFPGRSAFSRASTSIFAWHFRPSVQMMSMISSIPSRTGRVANTVVALPSWIQPKIIWDTSKVATRHPPCDWGQAGALYYDKYTTSSLFFTSRPYINFLIKLFPFISFGCGISISSRIVGAIFIGKYHGRRPNGNARYFFRRTRK